MRKLQAVYENGVLRPLEPLRLDEHQLVSVIVIDDAAPGEELAFESPATFEPLADHSISVDAVRRSLSEIPGSLDADFMSERNERQVPGYFVDTSALAKLFHPEAGSERMELLALSPGARLILSQLSLIEIQSVFATKVRTGAIDHVALDQLRGLFFAELARGRFEVVLLASRHLNAAEALVRTHAIGRGLRRLDAIQLEPVHRRGD